MNVSIGRSEINGRVRAPSSKSYTIRGLMCAALASGQSELVYPLASDDTDAATDVLRNLGVVISAEEDRWLINGGDLHAPIGSLNCRESAATIRFMTAIAAAIPGECRLTAAPSLMRRPIAPLIDALRLLGVECQQDRDGIVVRGGKLKGGSTSLPGNISSQYVSALLLAAPLAEQGMTVRVTTPLESRPYVEMTIECLKQFDITAYPSADFADFTVPPQQYQPARYVVEGDWSSASYLLAAGTISDVVVVDNLRLKSLQGDRQLVDLLRRMGASVVAADSSVTVRKSSLKAIAADLTDCIDLLPTVAVLAALAEGESVLSGISRARLKESDRVASVVRELGKAGVRMIEEKDRLIITGTTPKGARFDSHGDHRIAMAFSLIGLVASDTMIEGAECVSKTYPEYWKVLADIGGQVSTYGQ